MYSKHLVNAFRLPTKTRSFSIEKKNVSPLKHRSTNLTGDPNNEEQWLKRQAARAQVGLFEQSINLFYKKMRAVRFNDEDFMKPLITVACPYSNALPCNGTVDVRTYI